MYCYIPLFVMGDLCDGGPESPTSHTQQAISGTIVTGNITAQPTV